MGSVQGKEVDGVLFMEKSKINDLNMGNNSKPGLKFVTVPTSTAVVSRARKQLLTMSEEKSKKILDGTVKIDKSQGEFVGRAGLTYQNDGFAAKQQVRQTLSEERARKILDGTIKIDKSQGEFVGRAGFTYQTEGFVAKQQESQGKKTFAKSYINEMAKEAVFTDRKRNELNKIWPQIFYEMVYSALSDMSDMPSYSKKCLEELDKT